MQNLLEVFKILMGIIFYPYFAFCDYKDAESYKTTKGYYLILGVIGSLILLFMILYVCVVRYFEYEFYWKYFLIAGAFYVIFDAIYFIISFIETVLLDREEAEEEEGGNY